MNITWNNRYEPRSFDHRCHKRNTVLKEMNRESTRSLITTPKSWKNNRNSLTTMIFLMALEVILSIIIYSMSLWGAVKRPVFLRGLRTYFHNFMILCSRHWLLVLVLYSAQHTHKLAEDYVCNHNGNVK